MEENSKKDFLVAISNKITELEKKGVKFLLKFTDLGEKIELVITTGKKTITFTLSFDGETFFLENQEYRKPGGRPTFYQDNMIIYLLLLVNGSPIPGILTMPDYKAFKHLEAFSAT
jgi:hypothetical protein